MSIFGIIGLCFVIGAVCGLLALFIMSALNDFDDPDKPQIIITVAIFLVIWIAGIFIGIGLVTDYERAYVAKYEAQKYTIEASLNSDILSGLERVELVNQAAVFNGEMAERKAHFNRWHHATYDKHLYDDVELIDISGGIKCP